MCCCCPPAISALFCLWARSGFSKSSVAGALTFFPPSPALYKFERMLDGEPFVEDEDAGEAVEDEHRQLNSDKKKKKKKGLGDSSSSLDSAENNREDRREPIHPAQELTNQALKRRKRAKHRNAKDAKDDARGISYAFLPDHRLLEPPGYSGTIEAVKIGPCPKSKAYISATIYRQRPERILNTTKTIIYSHGNATDIGAMHFMQVVIAKGLKCNVVMYDYSGYGESGGVPLEENTYSDIAMVYDYVLNNVIVNKKNRERKRSAAVDNDNKTAATTDAGANANSNANANDDKDNDTFGTTLPGELSLEQDESNIILYGQSVGSGPSCYLAARRPDVGGLILHSPFMSGMRVLTPSRALACLDIFPNINRIKKVQSPVMVIHGMLDEEVHFSHGQRLHEAVPEDCRRPPWWVKDRGHNDITEGRAKLLEYIQRLKGFFDSLEADAGAIDGAMAMER
jgi:fermentation-respiration switch protein FrsA (DUF1100 family)